MLLNHTDIFYCFSHIHGFQLNVQTFSEDKHYGIFITKHQNQLFFPFMGCKRGKQFQWYRINAELQKSFISGKCDQGILNSALN